MTLPANADESRGPAVRRRTAWALIPVLLLLPVILRAQASPETVGRIEGADIAVKGQMSVAVENNRSTTILFSGSEVTVRTGDARILLAEGGEIQICGPAHLTLLKSGGAIILALDYGRLRLVLANADPLTVYTPLIVATPIAISGGQRDAMLGLEATGTLCVRAVTGAVRLDQQLGGQSVVVPQLAEMVLPSGQLESIQEGQGSCRCEAVVARPEPAPSTKPPEYSAPAKAAPANEKITSEKLPELKPAEPKSSPAPLPKVSPEQPALPGPPATETPTWKVVMPPLVFDAATPPPPPEPNPETILLTREVRDTPEVIFSGRVEAPPGKPHFETASAKASTNKSDKTHRRGKGFFAKIGGFFRHLFG